MRACLSTTVPNGTPNAPIIDICCFSVSQFLLWLPQRQRKTASHQINVKKSSHFRDFALLRPDILLILHQRGLLLHRCACLCCLQHRDLFLVSVAVVTLCQSHITHASASLFELQFLLLQHFHRSLLVALQLALKRVIPRSRVTRHASQVTHAFSPTSSGAPLLFLRCLQQQPLPQPWQAARTLVTQMTLPPPNTHPPCS